MSKFRISRTKGIKSLYAASIDAAGNITSFSLTPDQPAIVVDEDTAKKVADRHRERLVESGSRAGRLDIIDEKGKTVASVGEAGEEPKPAPPPANLPGLAEEVAELKLRVELIEEAEGAGTGGQATPQFTEEEVKQLKALLAAKPVVAAKDEQQPKGEQKPAA